MLIDGTHYRTIWREPGHPEVVRIIDQTLLPHEFSVMELSSAEEAAHAIREMHVRGAGLIGATAGYGMYLAALGARDTTPREARQALEGAARMLIGTRPTAKNLEWAVRRQVAATEQVTDGEQRVSVALATAERIAEEDAEACRRIGKHALPIIEEISRAKGGEPVNILTHCNAGWLAFVDYGSATAPIYLAHDNGLAVHVWVDETRPRGQGASLTAWELGKHGVPHHLVADNTGGHLMQHGLVDLVIVGSDRTTRTGDVANKIGTYLKAIAAKENGVPFYVALPSSTFDWEIEDGLEEIPIEERDPDEQRYVWGLGSEGRTRVLTCPEETPARNFAFDVTPARYVTGLITERGVCAADGAAIKGLYPEHYG
ncbi:MAG: S-methyl-5-thioribose-1-phosphate isomerase [Alkalispirochaetaceae bacterium]